MSTQPCIHCARPLRRYCGQQLTVCWRCNCSRDIAIKPVICATCKRGGIFPFVRGRGYLHTCWQCRRYGYPLGHKQARYSTQQAPFIPPDILWYMDEEWMLRVADLAKLALTCKALHEELDPRELRRRDFDLCRLSLFDIKRPYHATRGEAWLDGDAIHVDASFSDTRCSQARSDMRWALQEMLRRGYIRRIVIQCSAWQDMRCQGQHFRRPTPIRWLEATVFEIEACRVVFVYHSAAFLHVPNDTAILSGRDAWDGEIPVKYWVFDEYG